MSRKTGFDKETFNEYRRLKSLGLTEKQVAEQWGISTSTLYNARTGRTKRLSKRSQERVANPRYDRQDIDSRRAVPIAIAQDIGKITLQELQALADKGSTPRTRRLAKDELDRIENLPYSVEELQRLTFDRPSFYRSYRDPKTGKVTRVRLLLGRTKGDDAQAAIRRQLREKGVEFADSEYIDFGGYGGIN